MTLVSVPTWRSLRCPVFEPIRALPLPTGSSVKKPQVRRTHRNAIHFICLAKNLTLHSNCSVILKNSNYPSLPVQETPIRVPVHPVRSLARCTPTVPTAPAKPWSACGAAVRSAVWTPLPMSSLSPTASVWSGRLEIVWVSAFYQT